MATFLEVGLLENFSILFSFLFVMAIVFGIFSLTGVLSENRGIQVILSFVIGLMVLIVPDVNRLITTMVPWFVLFFIFILFLLMAYKIFGATDADIMGVLRTNGAITWFVGIIFIIIIIAAFSSVYGGTLLPVTSDGTDGIPLEGGEVNTATTDYGTNVAATFFHPKVLGMLFILILGVFAVAILGMKPD